MGFGNIYKGKRVLLTGHTGFNGAWLAEWLLQLGAEVTGYSLSPPTAPALFEQLGHAARLNHIVGDIRDLAKLHGVIDQVKPDFVFHLAAQPLVRLSYSQPVETYSTNVMGTVNLLEADLIGADVIMNSAIFLGTYPGLTKAMLDYEIKVLKEFISSR